MNADTFSIKRVVASLPVDTGEFVLARLVELNTMLKHISPYELRDDSRLAYRFVMGEVRHMGPWDVVHDMACMQLLCDTLPYQEELQTYLRALAEQMKRTTGASWTQVWKAVAELGPEMLKCEMMHSRGVRFPDFVPSQDENEL